MPNIEQVLSELTAFGQLQDALDAEVARSIGRQLQAEHAYRKMVLAKYGIAQAFAPEDEDGE